MQELLGSNKDHPVLPMAAGVKTILVVEDEQVVRGLLHDVLQRAGYRVLAFGHPDEGIAACGETGQHIDLLLTDVVLPGMNGLEMASRIKTIQPDVRVVFMSGYTEHILDQDGALDGPVEYLQKPFSLDTLRQRMKSLLESPAA
ncbi:MAG: response regulator [Acidobacteriota bacterium]|nr:response regulator [Acidobacteriota bacterium]